MRSASTLARGLSSAAALSDLLEQLTAEVGPDRWFRDWCDFAVEIETGAQEASGNLWRSYRGFLTALDAQEGGRLSAKAFAQRLTASGFAEAKIGQARVRLGCRLARERISSTIEALAAGCGAPEPLQACQVPLGMRQHFERWFAQRCRSAASSTMTASADLRADFVAWAERNDATGRLSAKAFGVLLGEAGAGRHKSSGRIFRTGIALVNAPCRTRRQDDLFTVGGRDD